LNLGSSVLGLHPGHSQWIVLLGKTINYQSASLYPGVYQ